MTHTVDIKHNFESAHRLYTQPVGSKCWSLHGHSFWANIQIEVEALDSRGMSVEFGELKYEVRSWIDQCWDHGALLNQVDPMVEVLKEQKCKYYSFHGDPTVEVIAYYLRGRILNILPLVHGGRKAKLTSVHIQETHVNGAGWKCSD